MRKDVCWWLFWLSLGYFLYTYLGYPLLVVLRGWLKPKPVRRDEDFTPSVCMVVAAHNEAAVISQKVENCLAQDYPVGRLEVIVASDGSTDDTVGIARTTGRQKVNVLDMERKGKNATLNAAVASTNAEVLVFSDADTVLAANTLRRLVAPFADPSVGGVGGDFHYAEDAAFGTFMHLDYWLNLFESRAGSMTNAVGQLYAIRRDLYSPVPVNVTDDAFISSQVPAARKRLVFEPGAIVYPIPATSDRMPQRPYRRHVRIATRWFKSVYAMRRLLNPFEYGFYSVQLWSHRVLRRLTALPILVLFIASLGEWQTHLGYRVAAIGQLAFHMAGAGAALAGDKCPRWFPPIGMVGHFYTVTVAGWVGFANLVRRRDVSKWTGGHGPSQ